MEPTKPTQPDKPTEATVVWMHRQVLMPVNGLLTDHINGDGLDNHRINLRYANNSQNSQNSRKTRRNLTGYKGVSHAFGGVYTATIQVLGRSIWLGQYSDAISAHQVYCRAASKYFGSFANSGEV